MEEYHTKTKKWEKEVNPCLFNLLYDHCTKDFRALLQSRNEWQATLDGQDGVAMVKPMHALHYLQDNSKPGMWEIVAHDQALFLCA